MKSQYRNLFNMLLILAGLCTAIVIQSCGCKQLNCPDIPSRIEDSIEILFSQDTVSGEGFFQGELSNLMLIKLEKTTEATELDTITPGPSVRVVTSVVIGPTTFGDGDNWVNFDYQLKNIDPVVDAILADIVVSGDYDDEGCCTIYVNTAKRYSFDGQTINNPAYQPIIVR